MAKITPGSIVSLVSGKLGGSVFTSSPNGMQIRPRAKLKVNRPIEFTQPKQWLGSFAAGWRNLTNAQRDAWIAATADYTYADRLGNTITMTGVQLYCAIGMASRLAGTLFTTSPPTPASYPTIISPELICDVDFMRFTGSWDDTPPDSGVALYASGPKSAGISSVSKSDLFWMDGFTNAENFDFDFGDRWTQRFGDPNLHIGKKVFAEIWIAPTDASDILRFVASGRDIIFT
jgi:hypothetical protein